MKATVFLLASLSALYNIGQAAAETPGALVVTSEELKPAFAEFADWKRRFGSPVEVVSVADIEKALQGKDNKTDKQEKIRRFIRGKIDNDGVRSVILGGDSLPDGGGHVPDRDTLHRTMWGENTAIPTDIFYLGKMNWDADGDGIFGEFEDDREAIDYPDGTVGIGRIPVRTPEDLAAYTAKVIAFESAFPSGDFTNRMIYTCAVPQAEAKLLTSWDKNVSKSWSAGRGEMFFTTRSPWDKDVSGDFDLSPPNFIDLINRGEVGKLHIHGHGLPHCWILEKDRKLSLQKLDQLKNEGAYPVITTVSCFTGMFDAQQDPCITEAMLRLPKAGAIAVLAPCREGKPHFTNPRRDFPLMMKEGKMDGTTETMTRFWQHAAPGKMTLGHAFTTMKSGLAERAAAHENLHMCLCELNFLGDPTLTLPARPPQTMDLKLPDALPAGESKLKVSGLPNHSTIVVSDGHEVFFKATALEGGEITIPISIPKGTENLSIGLQCKGYNRLLKRY